MIYTYCVQVGNKILSRGYDDNNRPFFRKEDFNPTLFVNSKGNSGWKDLYGNPVEPIQPGTIRDCGDFIDNYKDVDNFSVMGQENWVCQFISEKYPGTLAPDFSKFRIAKVDIETSCENGFPVPELAEEPIISITRYDTIDKKFYVYVWKDTTLREDILEEEGVDINDVVLKQLANENDMMVEFIMDWRENYPDVITGWNSDMFDIIYIVNRIENTMGENWAKKLSPWGLINRKKSIILGQEKDVIKIVGVNSLDYMDLVRYYTYGGRESWKLDDIAFEELGRRKLDYPGTFKDHYTNDWDHFVTYNIIDVDIVKALDAKLKLLDLALTIAYDSKINPNDVFSQIRCWDSLIYNDLKERKIAVPENRASRRESFEGAFVKTPLLGKHKWVVSFDLQSLYPHIMMWANISPETMTTYNKNVTVDGLLDMKFDNSDLVENGLSMTANGITYTKDKHGFIPEMVQRIYNERSIFKKKMLGLEQEYANTKDESLIPEISRLHNLQMARKIQINSVYGAMGTPYFRYYDLRMARGITTSGQLAIRWVSNDLNKLMNKICKTEDVDYCVYNDTDSCYFTLEKFVDMYYPNRETGEMVGLIDKFCNDVMQLAINKSYDKLAKYMNAYEQKMIMKREAIADVGVFVAKKRYALSVHNNEGVQYKEPKIKVTGLELVRSSTPRIVREILKNGVKEILMGNEDSTQKFIADYKKQYMTESIESISFPRGVNGLSKYAGSPIYTKGTPIHVRAALLFNHYIDKHKLNQVHEYIKEGDKMKFVYLRMPNPIHENIIGFTDKLPVEFGLNDYVDYDMMFNKSFVEGMKTIMDALNWTPEKVNTLEDLFG